MLRFIILTMVLLISSSLIAQQDIQSEGSSSATPNKMTNLKLGKFLKNLDQELEGKEGFWTLTIADFRLQVITDQNADRMRIISPITTSDALEEHHLYRLMQANFESALDARYSISNEVLWSTYIHPLTPLTEEELNSAILQVISLVATFGSSFSSTGYNFGGGDNPDKKEDKTSSDNAKT